MRSFRGSRVPRRNPLDRKIPGVLIRPDRGSEPTPVASYEWSSWAGAGRRHYRLSAGRGTALCGHAPGSLVLGSQLRQKAAKRPLCARCVALAKRRGVEVAE